MDQDGCWSTLICTDAERAALGTSGSGGWIVGCRLHRGHRGDHARDEMSPSPRRLWIRWDDAGLRTHELTALDPCPGASCLLFAGHPGTHVPAAVDTSSTTAEVSPPSVTHSGEIPVPVAADVPSMRGRAVRVPGVDDLPFPGRALDADLPAPVDRSAPVHRSAGVPRAGVDPEVVAALDEVVAALSRLTDLLRDS